MDQFSIAPISESIASMEGDSDEHYPHEHQHHHHGRDGHVIGAIHPHMRSGQSSPSPSHSNSNSGSDDELLPHVASLPVSLSTSLPSSLPRVHATSGSHHGGHTNTNNNNAHITINGMKSDDVSSSVHDGTWWGSCSNQTNRKTIGVIIMVIVALGIGIAAGLAIGQHMIRYGETMKSSGDGDGDDDGHNGSPARLNECRANRQCLSCDPTLGVCTQCPLGYTTMHNSPHCARCAAGRWMNASSWNDDNTNHNNNNNNNNNNDDRDKRSSPFPLQEYHDGIGRAFGISAPPPPPRDDHYNVVNETWLSCDMGCEANSYCFVIAKNVVAEKCPPFSISPAASTKITDCYCPAGLFGANGTECEICPENHYCPVATMLPLSCPQHSVSQLGTMSYDGCICNGGYTRNIITGVCHQCGANTYGTGGATICVPCPRGRLALAGSTRSADCRCPQHTVEIDDICQPICREGIPLSVCQHLLDQYHAVNGTQLPWIVWADESAPNTGHFTMHVLLLSDHHVPVRPALWPDAILPYDGSIMGSNLPPDEVTILIRDTITNIPFQSVWMKYHTEYELAKTLPNNMSTISSYYRHYQGEANVVEAGVHSTALVLGMHDYRWLLLDGSEPQADDMVDRPIYMGPPLTVTAQAAEAQKRPDGRQYCRHMNVTAHWRRDLSTEEHDVITRNQHNKWFTPIHGRVFTPDTCDMKWFTPDEGWQCLAERYPVLHYYGDSNGRRFLKSLISNGTWCDGRHDTDNSCLCEDHVDTTWVLTQPGGALGGPARFDPAKTPTVAGEFDPHHSAYAQQWWGFIGGFLSGQPNAIRDAHERLARGDTTLPRADVVIIGSVAHDSASMPGSLRTDIPKYAQIIESTLATLKEAYPHPNQLIVFRTGNSWISSPQPPRWYTRYRNKLYEEYALSRYKAFFGDRLRIWDIYGINDGIDNPFQPGEHHCESGHNPSRVILHEVQLLLNALCNGPAPPPRETPFIPFPIQAVNTSDFNYDWVDSATGHSSITSGANSRSGSGSGNGYSNSGGRYGSSSSNRPLYTWTAGAPPTAGAFTAGAATAGGGGKSWTSGQYRGSDSASGNNNGGEQAKWTTSGKHASAPSTTAGYPKV